MPKLDLTRARQIRGPWGETLAIKGAGYEWMSPPFRLARHYGVGLGKIALHHSTDGAILNPLGRVTGLTNLGGAGGYFDAQVAGGGSVDRVGRFVRIGDGNPYLFMGNRADLVGVRFLWVMHPDTQATMTLFSSSGASVDRNTDTLGRYRLSFWQGDGVNGSYQSSDPDQRPRLWEVEMTETQVKRYRDGTINSTSNHSWSSFPITRIGGNRAGATSYSGLMGDVIGVTLGPSADTAIADARAYLRDRFGLTS